MSILDQYADLERTIKGLQRAEDQYTGSIKQLKSEMMKRHQIETLKEAKKRKKELAASLKKEEKTFAVKLKAFQKKWGKKL